MSINERTCKTPEHDKRDGGDHGWGNDGPMHPDITAAYDYVDSVADSPDMMNGNAPMWCGWALREAFLAGISHAREWQPIEDAPKDGTPILGGWPDYVPQEIHWDIGTDQWVVGWIPLDLPSGYVPIPCETPFAWMPMPAPPVHKP